MDKQNPKNKVKESDKLKEFINKTNINRIDSKEFIFNKILIGDDGDDVPSVWEIRSENKVNRFTEKKAKTLYEYFIKTEWCDLDFKSLFKNDPFLSWVSSMILKISKDVDSTENRIKSKNNFIRNCKLMWLDLEVIPKRVTENCDLEIKRGIELKRFSMPLDRIKILEGSEWVDPNYVPDSFNPFKIIKN